MPQYTTGADRYLAKRNAGISPLRSDGSKCNPDTDTQSAAAEKFAADLLGCPFNDSVLSKGDGGFDFQYNLEVEVIWMGRGKDGRPRTSGNLIVNPYEPQRWADIYVVVSGSLEGGFTPMGWTTHRKLTSLPQRDFGFGMKFAMPVDQLYPIHTLTGMKKS